MGSEEVIFRIWKELCFQGLLELTYALVQPFDMQIIIVG
jgi:hypothetical protein